eukprot:m51a1_g4075 hypothetical protein (280) ;mRNA; f:766460-767376
MSTDSCPAPVATPVAVPAPAPAAPQPQVAAAYPPYAFPVPPTAPAGQQPVAYYPYYPQYVVPSAALAPTGPFQPTAPAGNCEKVPLVSARQPSPDATAVSVEPTPLPKPAWAEWSRFIGKWATYTIPHGRPEIKRRVHDNWHQFCNNYLAILAVLTVFVSMFFWAALIITVVMSAAIAYVIWWRGRPFSMCKREIPRWVPLTFLGIITVALLLWSTHGIWLIVLFNWAILSLIHSLLWTETAPQVSAPAVPGAPLPPAPTVPVANAQCPPSDAKVVAAV